MTFIEQIGPNPTPRIVPALLLKQGSQSIPLPGSLKHGTSLVVAPRRLDARLAHFPEAIYSLESESHLMRLIKVLLGDAGAGQLRKNFLLQRFRATLGGAHFLDLDRFYGALFGFNRLSYEHLLLSGKDVGTTDQWNIQNGRNASYRSRVEQFARAIPYGPSPVGMELAAEAVLAVDCDIYESFTLLDRSFASYGQLETDLVIWGELDLYTFGELEGFTIGPELPSPDRQSFLVIPKRTITAEERYAVLRVLNRLKPAEALVRVLTNGLEIHEETAIRRVFSDSEFWEIIPSIVTTTNLVYTVPSVSGEPVEQPRPPFTNYEGEGWSYMGDIEGVSSYTEQEPVFGTNIVPFTGPPALGKRNIDVFMSGDPNAYVIPEEVTPLFQFLLGLDPNTPFGDQPSIDLFGAYGVGPVPVFHTVFDITRWYNGQMQDTHGVQAQPPPPYTLDLTDDFLRVAFPDGTTADFGPDKAVLPVQATLAGRAVTDGVLTTTSLWDTANLNASPPIPSDDIWAHVGSLYTDRIPIRDIALQLWTNQSNRLLADDSRLQFWATPERDHLDRTREVMEVRFNSVEAINTVEVEVARYPHTVSVELYSNDEARWIPVVTQTITDSFPANFTIQVTTGNDYPGHPDDTRHWVPVTAKFTPILAARARVVLQRTQTGLHPLTQRQVPVLYSLAARRFCCKMQIVAREDAPLDPGPIAVTKNLLGDSVSMELRVDAADNLLTPTENYWRSEPMPMNNAVVNLYADIRDDEGSPQVIDRFFLDPIYAGSMMHLYWSDEEPTAAFEANNAALAYGEYAVIGTVVSGAEGLSFPNGNLAFVDVNRSTFLLDETIAWWAGIEVRPNFSQTGATSAVFDLDGNTLVFGDGIVTFTTVTGDTVSLPTSFQAGGLVRLIVAYLPEATSDMPAGINLWYESGLSSDLRASANVPITESIPAPPANGKLRLGGLISGANVPANFALRALVLKSVGLTQSDMSDFFARPTDYPVKPNYASALDLDTLNSVLRFSLALIAPEAPYGLYGGPGDYFASVRWHPLERDYTLQKGYLHMPPVLAKYWKFEFTSLVPEHFESFAPIVHEVKLFPASISAAQARDLTIGASLLEPGMTSLISGTTTLMFADSGDLRFADSKYLPQDYLPTDALYSTDAEIAQSMKDSGSNYSYATWHQATSAPQFTSIGTHEYDITLIEGSDKVGYFVGLKALRAYRVRYDREEDRQVYYERLLDTKHLKDGYTFTFAPGAFSSNSLSVMESLAYHSMTPVTAVQFATVQSPDALQLIPDDEFVDPAKSNYDWSDPADWHQIGDARISYDAVKRSANVDRNVDNILTVDAHNPTLANPPVSPVFAVIDDVIVDVAATSREFGGIESTSITVPVAGQVWAAVRFIADANVTNPYHLRILGTDGTVLADKEITARGGEVIESYVGYTLGSYGQSFVISTDWAPRTMVEPIGYPVAHGDPDVFVGPPAPPIIVPIDGELTVQLIQFGASTDMVSVKKLSLFEDAVIWEFSNDGGANFTQAIGIRNNVNGVLSFATPGNQLVWRATTYRENVVVSSIQIRPWYARSLIERAHSQRWGPNISSFDEYPPIDQDSEFRLWANPVPFFWWKISEALSFTRIPPEGAPLRSLISTITTAAATDSIGTPTDVPSRSMVLVRALSDGVPTPSDSVATTITPAAPTLPDLILTNVTTTTPVDLTTPIPNGRATRFVATVQNIGAPIAPGVIIGTAFYVDGAQTTWADQYTGGLATNATVTMTANNGPAGSADWIPTPGTHTILAKVDDPTDLSRIVESNELNNQMSITLTVASSAAAQGGLAAVQSTRGLNSPSDGLVSTYNAAVTKWGGQFIYVGNVIDSDAYHVGLGNAQALANCWKTAGMTVIPTFAFGLSVTGSTPYTMAQVAAGAMDSALSGDPYGNGFNNYGEWFATIPQGCVLRLGWEMNGPWFPWNVTGTLNGVAAPQCNPTDYIAAFRHVVTQIRINCPAIKVDWCVNSRFDIYGFPSAAYPGDAYVDYIGWDVYEGDPTKLQADWNQLQSFAIAHGKQISVPEYGFYQNDPNGVPYTTAQRKTWLDTLLALLESAPATGPGSIAYHQVFDEVVASGNIQGNAGFYGIDTVAADYWKSIIMPSTVSTAVSPTVDPLATANTQAVYLFLLNTKTVGKTVSGQHVVYRLSDDIANWNLIQTQTGQTPGVMGIDYFSWFDNPTGYQMSTVAANQHAIAHWQAGGLVTMTSFAYNPLTGVAGSSAASFPSSVQVQNMVISGTPENTALNTMLDRIAVGITELANSGVVVIYRPWQDWGGWWAPGNGLSHATMRNLWRYTFFYLRDTKALHNIIWAYQPTSDATQYATDWYPGNDVVDIILPSNYDVIGAGYAIPGYPQGVATGKPFGLGVTAAGSPPATNAQYAWTNFISALNTTDPQVMMAIQLTGSFGIASYPSSSSAYMNDARMLNLGELNWQSFLSTGTTGGQPDFVITSQSISGGTGAGGSFMTGDHLVFSVVVKNVGTVAAAPGTTLDVGWAVDVDPGLPPVPTGFNYTTYEDTFVAGLAPGASVTLTATASPGPGPNYWQATAGNHTLYAVVDPNAAAFTRYPESNTANNKFQTTFTVNSVVGTGFADPVQTLGYFPLDGTALDTVVYLQNWNVARGRQMQVIAQNAGTDGYNGHGFATVWDEEVARATTMGSRQNNGSAWWYPRTNPNCPVRVSMTVRISSLPNYVETGGAFLQRNADALNLTASGGNDAHFIAICNALKDGGANPTAGQYIDLRLGHEFDGGYYSDNASQGGVAAFKAAFQHAATVFRANLAGCRIVLNFNGGVQALSQYQALDPGSSFYDIVGQDVYFNSPDLVAAKNYVQNAVTVSEQFAVSVGKPLCFPEWGIGAGTDSINPATGQPYFPGPGNNGASCIPFFSNLMATLPATGPGSLLYHIWFEGFDGSSSVVVNTQPALKAQFNTTFNSPAGGTAIALSTTYGAFVQRGGVAAESRAYGTQFYRTGRIIKQFAHWPASPPFINNRIIDASQNPSIASGWSTPAIGGSEQNVLYMPRNMGTVVWSTGGAGSITVNTGTGPQTVNIGANALATTVRTLLASLSNIGSTNNVDVFGDATTNGYAIMFFGSLTNTDVTVTVSGAGWQVRQWKQRYTIVTGDGNQGNGYINQNTWTPSVGLAQIAAGSGAAWTNFQQWANIICAYFPNSDYQLLWEGLGNWYQWSAFDTTGNNIQAANFVAAYQRMADYIRTRCAAAGGTPWFDLNLAYFPYRTQIDSFYWDQVNPGSGYVDSFSFDTYGPDNSSAAVVNTYAQWFRNVFRAYVVSHNKKNKGLSEWAGSRGSDGGGDNAFGWCDMLGAFWQEECAAGRARDIGYFDTISTGVGGATVDWTYDHSPLSRASVVNVWGSS